MGEVSSRMPVRRLVAAADMAAGTADPEMEPRRTYLEALLAAKRTWGDGPYVGEVGTGVIRPGA